MRRIELRTKREPIFRDVESDCELKLFETKGVNALCILLTRQELEQLHTKAGQWLDEELLRRLNS